MTALAEAEAKTDTNPTLGQIGCGNYRKGKYRIHGLRVSIENPRGSIRTAKDGSWRVRMPAAYGYILGTKGADKDHLDCFCGPHSRSPLVYVVDQRDAETGQWDEHKCFFGYSSPQQVKRVYFNAFSDGKGADRLGALHEMTVAQFKQWLSEGNTKKPFKRASGGRIGMADGGAPVTDPGILDQLNAPKPVTDPALLETLNAPDQGNGLSSYLPDAITDIPHEIANEAGNAASTIKQGLFTAPDPGIGGGLNNVKDTAAGLAAIPQLIFSPITGTYHSVLGHMGEGVSHLMREGAVKLYGEDAVRKAEEANDITPGGETYEDVKRNIDTAMSAMGPAGVPIKVGGAYQWKAPTSPVTAFTKQKPVGVVPQPDTEAFFDAADNHYSNMRGFGVEIDPKAMNGVADNILTELHAEGYRPRNAPKVFDAVDELRNPAGQNHEISDIDSVRKVLGKARLDPSERDAARRAIGHIDDYLANLGKNPQDVVVNPQFAGRVGEEAQAARANYAVAKRSEDIDEALDQAERQAARAGSGGNINNAIRQRLSALRNNKKKMAGWTDDEKTELDKVINGSKGANAARSAGKFAPHGIVSTVMSAGAGHAIMPGVGEVAVPAAGLVAKMVGDRMTRIAAERLSNVVKARSPLGRQTSINAAAQSALTPSNRPRVLPAAVRAALPYSGPNLGPRALRALQGPVGASADQKQQ